MYNVDMYTKNNYLQQKVAVDCFKKYANIRWKEDNHIIDVGCGEGTVISVLKKYFHENSRLLGCDLNYEMIMLAKERYSDEKTSFMVFDILSDLQKDMRQKFSHVFSFFALNWIKDQRSAFSNIFELLEPDGQCFVVIVGHNSVYEVYRELAQNSRWKPWLYDVERHISVYHDMQDPIKETTNMLEKIGFDNIVVEHEDVIHNFETMEDMKLTLEAVSPFKIPSEKKHDYWEDYIKQWNEFEGIDNKDLCIKDIKLKFKVVVIYGHRPKDFHVVMA